MNKTNVNHNNWVAREELYRRHCTERDAAYGFWRYRHVIAVLPALAVGAVAWMVTSHFAEYPFYAAHSRSPFIHTLMAVYIAWIPGALVAESLFAKHQRRVLHRAGIEIPPPKRTSFRALIRNRKQIKLAYQRFCISHRRPTYRFLSTMRYIAALFAPLVFIGAHIFGLPPSDRIIADDIAISVTAPVSLWFYVEFLILYFGWTRVNNHVPCPDCRGTPLGATSTAFSNENKEDDPEYLAKPWKRQREGVSNDE